MSKIKEFSKKYLIGFTLGLLSAGIVVVYAETYFPSNQTTYDNSVSGLSSTNVQGAIDELYNTCFPPTAGEQIINDNNLEKDPYECRYFFKGTNPNNYITFNNEKAGWRIISVECDGSIKIMRINSIGQQAWDSSNSNNWARPATLNTYLNGTYYNNLNSVDQSKIVTSNFSIGQVTNNNDDLASQINDENATKWNGKIALPTLSEYLRTNSNENCKTIYSNNSNSSVCAETTWMFYSSNVWLTLSTPFWSTNKVYSVTHGGAVYSNRFVNFERDEVRPALYLSSEIKITGGDGSQSNPYTIE